MMRRTIAIFIFVLIVSVQPLLVHAFTLTAYQRCGDKEYLLQNGFLLMTNLKKQFFVATNGAGSFILSGDQMGEFLLAYLANEREIIFPGCRSDVTSSAIGRLILHGLCPARNCISIYIKQKADI